jgi:hypothetical protein
LLQKNLSPVAGRCEICKFKFRFDPQYAENAPDRLPAYEVLLGLSSRFTAKWLPLAIRIFIAASVWLAVAPLLTNLLYHGWMVRPSSILTRWKRELIFADIVSGAVTVAIIIISFLSLMSFADFLRVHWQQRPRDQLDRQQQGGLPFGANEGRVVDDGNDTDEKLHIGRLDLRVIFFLKSRMEDSESFHDGSPDSLHGNAESMSESAQGGTRELLSEEMSHPDDQNLLDRNVNETLAEEEKLENENIPGDDQNDDNGILDNADIDEVDGPQEAGNPNDDNGQAFDPLDPFLQDDQVVSMLPSFTSLFCLLNV